MRPLVALWLFLAMMPAVAAPEQAPETSKSLAP